MPRRHPFGPSALALLVAHTAGLALPTRAADGEQPLSLG